MGQDFARMWLEGRCEDARRQKRLDGSQKANVSLRDTRYTRSKQVRGNVTSIRIPWFSSTTRLLTGSGGMWTGERAADSFTASQLSSEAMYEAKEATCRVSAIGQSVGRLTESESESVSIVDRRLSIDV
jgi:hypothetical protein